MSYIQELRSLTGHRPLIIAAVGVVIFDDRGRVLLQHRYDDSWGIPGGAMEPGETLEETARREVREETMLELGALTLVDVYSGPEFFARYPNGDEAFFVMAVYETREAHGTIVPDGGETLALAYFPLDDLPPRMLGVAKSALDRYVRDRTTA